MVFIKATSKRITQSLGNVRGYSVFESFWEFTSPKKYRFEFEFRARGACFGVGRGALGIGPKITKSAFSTLVYVPGNSACRKTPLGYFFDSGCLGVPNVVPEEVFGLIRLASFL